MVKLQRIILFILITVLGVSANVWAQPGSPHNNYIIVLNSGTGMPASVASEVAIRTGGNVGYIYETVLSGFSISMPRAAVAAIQRDPRIAYIEEDIYMSIFTQTTPTGIRRINTTLAAADPTGLTDERVDADVAVLDTGIDRQHPDLNVFAGANCLAYSGNGPPWARSYFCDETKDGNDDHYHGTHVAGTIGALNNNIGVVGVAPGVRLWAVKVLDSQGSGTLSGIIAGIDWVASRNDIEVINMSLGGSGQSDAMDTAIVNAFNSGVTVVVAAGNSDSDAANYTPANSPNAITVSALADFNGEAGGLASYTCRVDQDDTLADFSNWGFKVDIAAPGVCIESTFPEGSLGTISGTSMAAPHVAGAAALLASQGYNPESILTTLITSGNITDWIDDSGDGSKEPLLDISSDLFSNPDIILATNTTSNQPPVASFTKNCNDSTLSCDFNDNGSADSDGSIASYFWNFGDGTTALGSDVSHTYSAAGTYTVTLTVTDDDNDTGMAQQDVTLLSGESTTSLNTNSVNNGSTWTAIVWKSTGQLSGTWTYDGTICIVDSPDVCLLAGIPKKQGSVEFETTNETVTVFKP